MSNHSGSYMLNNTLNIAYKMGILESIGKDKACEFALNLVEMGRRYDCNNGEILEDIGERLGICYYCLKIADDFEDGLCKNCR